MHTMGFMFLVSKFECRVSDFFGQGLEFLDPLLFLRGLYASQTWSGLPLGSLWRFACLPALGLGLLGFPSGVFLHVTDHPLWVCGSGFGSWCLDLPLCSAPGLQFLPLVSLVVQGLMYAQFRLLLVVVDGFPPIWRGLCQSFEVLFLGMRFVVAFWVRCCAWHFEVL
jgi:hypothetical protein